MRKRNSAKKKANAIAKVNDNILDSLFTDIGLTRRSWYTKQVHEKTLETLVKGSKLQAVKDLMDLSRANDGDGRYGLKNLKDFVDQFDFNVRQKRIALGLAESTLPFNTDQPKPRFEPNLVDKVVLLTNVEIRNHYSTTGLAHLLSFVPQRILQEYWEGSK